MSVINRALQLLGQPQIKSPNENSSGANAIRSAYDSVVLASLRRRVWKFAIKRASLAADATAPLFGKARAFPLPSDFLRLAPEETTYSNPMRRDWEIEGKSIITDDGSPLQIRYVATSITESDFDPLFAESLSIALAIACCEEITNSNTKLQNLSMLFSDIDKEARRTNSIESSPVKSPTGSWIAARH